MSTPEPETIILSIGGSLIVPDAVDTTFLTNLTAFISSQTTDLGRSFIIVPGGGRTSRNYVTALSQFTADHVAHDRLGIAACAMNGALLSELFKDNDQVQVRPDPELYEPGASSDRACVRTAIKHGASKVVNLSNISHVYTADPNTDPTAQKLERISWADFRKLIPDEFTPNLSSPFDPEAAKLAQEHHIEVATIHGDNLPALTAYLAGDVFEGTVIL